MTLSGNWVGQFIATLYHGRILTCLIFRSCISSTLYHFLHSEAQLHSWSHQFSSFSYGQSLSSKPKIQKNHDLNSVLEWISGTVPHRLDHISGTWKWFDHDNDITLDWEGCILFFSLTLFLPKRIGDGSMRLVSSFSSEIARFSLT